MKFYAIGTPDKSKWYQLGPKYVKFTTDFQQAKIGNFKFISDVFDRIKNNHKYKIFQIEITKKRRN